MQQPKYIKPTLGRKSIAIVLAWCLVQLAAYFYFFSSMNPGFQLPKTFSLLLWLVGTIYGVSSGACWAASIVKKASYRSIVRACIAASSALWMTQLATFNWQRHLANLGGLMVFQCILFFALKIPDWEPRGVSQPARLSAGQRHQFRIADVIVATTSIALVLSIGIRYATPIEPVNYWFVMVLVWLACPLIAASLFTATTRGSVRWGLLAAMLAAGTAIGLSAAEYVVSNATLELSFWLPFYSNFALAFFLSLLVVGLAGRVERPIPAGSETSASDLDT